MIPIIIPIHTSSSSSTSDGPPPPAYIFFLITWAFIAFMLGLMWTVEWLFSGEWPSYVSVEHWLLTLPNTIFVTLGIIISGFMMFFALDEWGAPAWVFSLWGLALAWLVPPLLGLAFDSSWNTWRAEADWGEWAWSGGVLRFCYAFTALWAVLSAFPLASWLRKKVGVRTH